MHFDWLKKLLELVDDNNKLKLLLVQGWNSAVVESYFDRFDIQGFIRDWYDLVQATNKLMEDVQPWVLLKQSSQKAKEFLEFGLHLIRNLALVSSPVLISSVAKLAQIIGDDAFA